jgi:quinoprotein glucose dehydrogenase
MSRDDLRRRGAPGAHRAFGRGPGTADRRVRSAAGLLLAGFLALITGRAGAAPGEGIVPPPPPPAIAARPADAAALAAGFGLPDGFTAVVFATEPDVANPVALALDGRGRCFVAETFSLGKQLSAMAGLDPAAVLEADLSARTVADRLAATRRLLGDKAAEWHRSSEQVRLLEDRDGDGRADRATVFAAGFNGLLDGHASGVLAREDDVFLASVPAIWRLRDADGDGVADERTPLHAGFGVREGMRGHDLHGLVLGPDGRLYFSLGDRGFHVPGPEGPLADPETGAVFRCEPDGSGLEVVATGLRNPQGLAFDDAGNLFTVDNNADFGDRSRLVQIVPGGDSGWRMTFFDLPDRGPFGREGLWHLPHEGQPAWIVPPLAHLADGPAGLDCYPGTGLTPHFAGRFLLADFCGSPANSSIRSFRLRPAGAAFELTDEEQTFRHVLATDVTFGPDGAVWVANWVEPQAGEARGRIWRFVPEDDASPEAGERARSVAEVRGLLAGDWVARDAAELTALLAHADRRVRCAAHGELARRGEAARLAAVAAESSAAIARRHAAWGLGQIGRRAAAAERAAVENALVPLLRDAAWENRVVACQCLGDLVARGAAPAIAALLEDPQLHVRAAAAFALGRIGDPATAAGIVAALRRAAAGGLLDPHLRHALVMGIVGTVESTGLASLAADADAEVRLAACLALRRRADPGIAACLDDADPRIAVEAARAIHDVPIPAAADALVARLAAGPAAGPIGDALLRRAISAAERQGTPQAARLLAQCAARTDVSPERRREALEVLSAWASPPPRDRVLAAWRPAAARDVAAARAALEPLLAGILAAAADTETDLVSAALSAAAAVGCAGVGPMLEAAVADDGRSPEARATALQALAVVDEAAGLARARDCAAAAESPLRRASRKVRATHEPAAAVAAEFVAVALSEDGDLPLAERQQAIDLLAASDEPAAVDGVRAVADAVEAGRLEPALELDALEAVERRLDAGTAARLRTVREAAATAAGIPPGWHDVARGGDADRGRRVFFDNAAVGCVRCHRAEGRGGNAGPPLDGLAGSRDRGHLIESIVAPSARFSDGYAATIVTTTDGRSVHGIVEADDGERLAIRTADGTLHVLAADEIDERASGASAMPAGLDSRLTRRELRDLVEWLSTLDGR